MTLIRNVAFALVFYGLSVPIVLLVPFSALFGRRALISYATGWARFHRWCARWLLGVRARYEGPRPEGQVFFAAKHQSMFETLDLIVEMGSPVVIMRREFARIPIWGWATQVYGIILVDRSASASALRALMREAKIARDSGRSVILFPEGTRVKPGDHPPLKSGFAGLYKMLDLPVVPIATDVGQLWPKNGLKRAGVATFRFGDPIPPGLPRAEIEARVHAAINVLDIESCQS
ncbi:MAG: 1-acyl-sn-glycerol-3-phosphate acyltransferase [Sphingomonas sp.]|uniref:lysophospholipid acyltransferase family protein n=1 Tax=Sphingomonas sp. TaxID=28214 RepID=UPI001201D5FA|nr:lysophospholipid acyltransferase family protein [Sphingomonas sp.]THD36392.1 MAG: 1-acyl-sn-glycerol-3-phosphate acyltransferase [Sphingomonas sp.]